MALGMLRIYPTTKSYLTFLHTNELSISANTKHDDSMAVLEMIITYVQKNRKEGFEALLWCQEFHSKNTSF